MKEVDILIIGAGSSGSVVSALLNKHKDLKILVVEKELFPRFVIGESLLPFCMQMLEEAGFLEAVKAHGFQFKNGAAFSYKDEYRYFDFCDKSSAGYGTTFQVQRGDFDKLLIDEAIKQGVEVKFQTCVEDVKFQADFALVSLKDLKENKNFELKAKFIIDASGYGRVLPRIMDLETPSNLAARKAYFTHIEDNISEVLYDRKKILITTHPEMKEVWFWLIPFSNGRCSLGVVGEPKFVDIQGLDELETLKTHTFKAPLLKRLLKDAKFDTPVRSIHSYSKDVKTLFGERFLLLGNASEFLDPVFSSGVSIAMYSAHLAAKLAPRILKGEKLDLNELYAKPLMLGINTFRTYVEGWYDGSFQRVIYTKNENNDIKRQICSILAGYAWDMSNVYVRKSKEALKALEAYC